MMKFQRIRRSAILLLVALLSAQLLAVSPVSAADRFQLLLFEHENCVPCKAFKRDIGKTYKSTPQGKRAPLKLINTRRTMPKGYKRFASIKRTPTFVVLKNGQEVDRMTGYGGPFFFWNFLDAALAEAS